MKKIVFFINYQSGTNKKNIRDLINNYIDLSIYKHSIIERKNNESFEKLIKNIDTKNTDIVAVCGGDGSVNYFSNFCYQNNIILAIIPTGSGNSISRTLGIPNNVKNAINTINKQQYRAVDLCEINNHIFMGLAGIGFDAHIAYLFKNKKNRGIWGYVKTIIPELKFPLFEVEIITKDNIINTSAFMLTICNTNQWGNNFKNNVNATPFDGIISCLVIKDYKFYKAPIIALHSFLGILHKAKSTLCIDSDSFKIRTKNKNRIHIDGEPLTELFDNFEVKVIPKAIQVII